MLVGHLARTKDVEVEVERAVVVKIANLSNGLSASPAGLGFVGILPCSLQWQPPGKAPKLLGYSSAARSISQPYAMPASGNNCCSNSNNGCCLDCRCCKQGYEHLPVPRLLHQQPPPPLNQNPQQQGHQQVSCITTLQQTTTTQQLQQLSPTASSNPNFSIGNCLMPATTTSTTYVSSIGPENPLLAMQHCHSHSHSHCNAPSSNLQPCSKTTSNMQQACSNSSTSNTLPAIYNNAPTQPMILVPFMLPMQQQHHQQQHQHLQLQPPLPPPEDCKPLLPAKSVPPPPQPPPLLTHFQPLLQPPPLPPSPTMPQPPVACPLPSRPPATPPIPGIHSVQSLKSAAASALSVYQRSVCPSAFHIQYIQKILT
ncbi:formin-like protein 5 [Drosophila ficusphila]|uniref:formin-like protein 5 n=1 Tax=Drosophila ficusphila TaxID=30025 RepID=UPI001C8990A6|nr:formin-like protein 5 [Drosophila ficusphila]